MNEKLVTYKLAILEEDLQVRGNVVASEDEDYDKKCEDEILARLDRGDIFAWFTAKVTATYAVDSFIFEGEDFLGGCSYKDEEDFKQGGYYESMKQEALRCLIEELERAVERGEVANSILAEPRFVELTDPRVKT